MPQPPTLTEKGSSHFIDKLTGTLSTNCIDLHQTVQDKLKHMYLLARTSFLKHTESPRTNMLNVNYVSNRLLNLIDFPSSAKYFKLLKSPDNLKYHDDMWEKICSDNGWDFLKSVNKKDKNDETEIIYVDCGAVYDMAEVYVPFNEKQDTDFTWDSKEKNLVKFVEETCKTLQIDTSVVNLENFNTFESLLKWFVENYTNKAYELYSKRLNDHMPEYLKRLLLEKKSVRKYNMTYVEKKFRKWLEELFNDCMFIWSCEVGSILNDDGGSLFDTSPTEVFVSKLREDDDD